MIVSFGGVDEAGDLLRERAPLARHVIEPLRVEQPLAREAPENRIDGAFGDDEIGERFEVLDDGEPVAGAGGNRQQDREVEAAASKLLLPGLVRHTLCRKVWTNKKGRR